MKKLKKMLVLVFAYIGLFILLLLMFSSGVFIPMGMSYIEYLALNENILALLSMLFIVGYLLCIALLAFVEWNYFGNLYVNKRRKL